VAYVTVRFQQIRGPGFVTIARCTIRLRQADAADPDLFHDAKPSNTRCHLRY
jgi:hypothetical protein